MKLDYYKDANCLTILANDLSLTAAIDNRDGCRSIKPAIEVKVKGYDLREVVSSILEDYPSHILLELVFELEKGNEEPRPAQKNDQTC